MQHDRFVLRRRRPRASAAHCQIAVSGLERAGEAAFWFVVRQRTGLREEVWFFADEGQREEVMGILTRDPSDPRGRYAVITPDELVIGEIQKRLGRSMIRSSYVLFDESGAEVCEIRERRLAGAIGRRLLDLVDVLAIAAQRMRGAPLGTDFHFVRDGRQIGAYRRRGRDGDEQIHDIDLSADAGKALDRRLALAACVAVDALQGR